QFAHALATGGGVAPDPARAAQLYDRACNEKVLAACVGLGRLYMEGKGVERDDARAAHFFKRSCVRDVVPDEPEGCYYLGQLYATGRGVTLDVDSAALLARRACDLGYTAACPRRRES